MAAVRRYNILDTPPDGAFDRVANLAARILGTPIATVTIVDEDRIWFKAKHGLEVEQIDRLPGLCASAIMRDEPYLVTDASLDPRSLANPLVTGDSGFRFYAAAPLITSDGHRLGTLNVIDRHPRSISQEETQTLQDLAAVVMDELELRLAAQKVVQAKAEVEKLGEALQRSVLPPPIPFIPGLELAGYYQPAKGGLEICGDFYDVFETRAGTWVVTIGDVCGKGVEASVIMSSVRHRLRALAEANQTPAEVLVELNESLVREVRDGSFCTLLYMLVRPDPGGAHITLSSGGHPLPLLRHADGSIETVGVPGSLVGAFPDIEVTDESIFIGPGDLLLLYTDGVVERRGEGPAEAEEMLRSTLSSCCHEDAEISLKSIESSMPQIPGGLEDDTAMLLLLVCPEEGAPAG